jgi:hypothetical protein
MEYYEIMKLKRAKLVILSKDYSISRADKMNDKVQHWKLMLRDATTTTEKKFCISMIEMYLKRYTYYINKGIQ